MCWHQCDGGGRHYPFGNGAQAAFLSPDKYVDFKSSNVFQLPISTLTNDANDSGVPLCLSRPEQATEELRIFEELALAVARELLLLQHGRSRSDSGGVDQPEMVVFAGSDERFDIATTHLSVDYAEEGFLVRLFSDIGAIQLTLSAQELRSRHPKTGEKLELGAEDKQGTGDTTSIGMVQHHKVSAPRPLLMPATIEKKGRYGYSVDWADGATIIYSMISIAKAAGGRTTR